MHHYGHNTACWATTKNEKTIDISEKIIKVIFLVIQLLLTNSLRNITQTMASNLNISKNTDKKKTKEY